MLETIQKFLMNDPTLWVLLSFIAFIALAFALGRRSVLGMMDDKIAKIRQQIDNAEKLKYDAEALLKNYSDNLANASKDAANILAKAKVQAADYRKQEELKLQESMARRESMLQNRIEQMERSAIDDIRRYAAELAVSATTEIISQKLTSADAQRLSDESIHHLSEKIN